jgi:hypothetical protein
MVQQRISQRIRAWLQEGEDILTSLLGLIIAISGLIAFADVFSSGRALSFLPILLWVWIITQAIAVDYQFYITVKRQFTAKPVDKLVYWIRWILIAVLGVLVVVIGAIFAVHESQGAAIDTSMSFLGIPLFAFMYARAASPVLLLFVIAVDHALDRTPEEQSVQTPQIVTPETTEVIHQLATQVRQLTLTVTQISQELPTVHVGQPLLPERTQERKGVDSGIDEQTITGTFVRVKSYLDAHPSASTREVGDALGFSATTASKWMNRVKAEQT